MQNTNKLTVRNGTLLICDGLAIYVPNIPQHYLDDILKRLNEDLRDGMIPKRFTPQDLKDEIDRLLCLMQHIVDDFPDKLDIFDYLPLTKSGKFPGNAKTPIARACFRTSGAFDSDNAGGLYIQSDGIQLRLDEAFCSDPAASAFNDNEIRELILGRYSINKNVQPVFDENDIPHKILPTAKTVYLKDSEIKPGFIYEEKSGKQYLCLDHMEFCSQWLHTDDNGGVWGYGPDRYTDLSEPYGYPDRQDPQHRYVRWTKKLQTALGAARDFNALAHILANAHPGEPWPQTGCISVRISPRKFVKEIGQAIDPALTRTETWREGPIEYYLFDNNKIPDGWNVAYPRR